jgi:hypothetical protein
MNTYYKQPADKLDYDVTFENWLPDGDTVTTVEISVQGDGFLLVDQYANDGKTVKVWLSGGTNGSTYKVTVKVSTINARIKETEFKIRIKEL